MKKFPRVIPVLTVLILAMTAAACVSVPTGPSVMALPGTGKSFDQFRGEDAYCRQFALDQLGGKTAQDAANESGVRSAAIGTVIGAVAGAALGGHQGAGVGAGAGLLMGSAAGAGAGEASAMTTQRRYDNAYVQCMYGQGNRVPVAGRLESRPAPSAAPAGNAPYPPPPPGNSPPPPPGYGAPPPR